MRADLQNRIAPMEASQGTTFSAAKTKQNGSAAKSESSEFRDLLVNSNEDTKKEREAKKNGDFSSAKNDKELFQMIEDQTHKQRAPKNNLDKDDFMKLFVTQLQQQDPLQPKDSSEMAAQLANFNSLEQMMNVNKTLEKLVSNQAAGELSSKVSYIGKELSLNGGRIRMTGGTPSDSTFSLGEEASQVSMQVRNSQGVVVADKIVGALPKGDHPFAWDGVGKDGQKLPDGVYTYSISAKNNNGVDIPAKLTSRVRVTGVDVQDADGEMFTDVGKIKSKDIAAVGMPGFAEALQPSPTKPAPKAPFQGIQGVQGAPGSQGAQGANDFASKQPQQSPPDLGSGMPKMVSGMGNGMVNNGMVDGGSSLAMPLSDSAATVGAESQGSVKKQGPAVQVNANHDVNPNALQNPGVNPRSGASRASPVDEQASRNNGLQAPQGR